MLLANLYANKFEKLRFELKKSLKSFNHPIG